MIQTIKKIVAYQGDVFSDNVMRGILFVALVVAAVFAMLQVFN